MKILDPTKRGAEACKLEDSLFSRIVSQREAVEALVCSFQSFSVGLAPLGRPVSTFLFLGPTGCGKTRVVEALSEGLFGTVEPVIKIDCGEYQHSHEIAKLIGSPPGYLGHRETHARFSPEILSKHHTSTLSLTLVLFDEIEKASDALWNILLGILDKARLTLGDNRVVDFSRCMIFMTSNCGARELNDLAAPHLGFNHRLVNGHHCEADEKRSKTVAIEAARRKFTPEFMNRIDRVIAFSPLSTEDMQRVLELELQQVRDRIARHSGGKITIEVSDCAKALLLAEGTDARYGARHLKRAVNRLVIEPLSNIMASGQLETGDVVRMSAEAERKTLSFSSEPVAKAAAL